MAWMALRVRSAASYMNDSFARNTSFGLEVGFYWQTYYIGTSFQSVGIQSIRAKGLHMQVISFAVGLWILEQVFRFRKFCGVTSFDVE